MPCLPEGVWAKGENMKEKCVTPVLENDDSFRSGLRRLINRQGYEKGSDTPDFILAEYLSGCLDVFDKAVKARSKWWNKGDNFNGIGKPKGGK